MRYLYLFCLLLLLPAGLLAQPAAPTRTLEQLYDQLSAYQVARYQPDSGYQLLTLPSTFSDAELHALHLRERQLVRVDLVYSAYHLDPKFDQRRLNLDRLRNLERLRPGVLRDPGVTWNLIEQTGCTSPAECGQYFHGFVLYTEKRRTAADSRAELQLLDKLLREAGTKIDKVRAARRKPGVPLSCRYPRSYYKLRKLARRVRRGYHCPEKASQAVRFRAEVAATGELTAVELLPDTGHAPPPCPEELIAAVREGFAFASGFALGKQHYPFAITGRLTLPVRAGSLRITGYYLADSLMRRHRIQLGKDACLARLLRPGDPTEDDPILVPDARAVARVLERHPSWQGAAIVADVTGSMYPHLADLLVWLQLNLQEQDRTFVFFNDGNDAPDSRKPLGRTGGLYAVQTHDYARVRQTIEAAMQAGGGGDAPENDVEALLHAHALAPQAPELIWLADNHTFPRDVELLRNTQLPVHIVLCGARDFVNPRYLDLARQYGYSLHTLTTDLPDLRHLAEDGYLTLGRARYQLTPEGRFRFVGLK